LKGIIFIDDKRYRHTQNYLERTGHEFCSHTEPARNLDFVIFPFAAEINTATFSNDFFADLRQDVQVFSGIRHSYVCDNCKLHDLNYHVLMDDKTIAAKNAVPTSEGVIAYLVQSRDKTIAGSRVLIVGYGICGRDLALRLHGLGADVTTLVRRDEKAREARSDGVSVTFLQQFDGLDFDIIINTVPATVLTAQMLENRADVLFIDIASRPYGLDMELCKRLNPHSALLSGIPGKYAVKTAGEILGEHIHQILGGAQNNGY